MYAKIETNTEKIQLIIKFLERELKQKDKWDTDLELDCEVLFLEAVEYSEGN